MAHVGFLLLERDVLVPIHVQCPCLLVVLLLRFALPLSFSGLYRRTMVDRFELAIRSSPMTVLLGSCLLVLILRILLLIEAVAAPLLQKL